MSNTIIRVENLSKKFIIGHQRTERYTALRDVIAQNVKGVFKKTGDLFKGKASTEGESQEDFWALRDINFEIKQGDRVGIIGRNGAGKSTLLKILSRITEPTQGRIVMKGRVASLLEVGTGFHPELTGRENIFLNGAILGMTRVEIKRKFDEIVAFSEVERFLDTPVKRYSSGMYVRLAFAVAAHLEPEILIVDEVLAVGDAQFQKKCLGKMEDVSINEGRTVLFVSHNMNVIKSICETGMILSQGKMLFNGSAAKVVEKYLEVNSNVGNTSKDYFHKASSPYARVINITVNKTKNPLLTVFDNLNIEMEISVQEKINLVEFFIIIYNVEGVPVLGLFQKDNDEYFNIDGVHHKVSVSLKNSLAPGKYFISAGMFDRSRHFIDWVEFAETFEVESAYTDGRLFEPRLGMTVQKVEWQRVI